MKGLGWVFLGLAAGGLVALLRPREARQAVTWLQRTGADRAVFAIATPTLSQAAAASVPRLLRT